MTVVEGCCSENNRELHWGQVPCKRTLPKQGSYWYFDAYTFTKIQVYVMKSRKNICFMFINTNPSPICFAKRNTLNRKLCCTPIVIRFVLVILLKSQWPNTKWHTAHKSLVSGSENLISHLFRLTLYVCT